MQEAYKKNKNFVIIIAREVKKTMQNRLHCPIRGELTIKEKDSLNAFTEESNVFDFC